MQLCWNSLSSGASAAVIWCFPQVFVATPVVQTCGQAGSPHLVTAGAVTATGAELSAWDLAGSRAAIGCGLVAVGRWY